MRRLAFHTIFVVAIALALGLVVGPATAQHYQRTTLLVESLVCASCLGLIESNMRKIPGVAGMSADLRTRTVTVDHMERIPAQQLAETVSRLGYPNSVVKEEAVEDSKTNKFSNSFARCGVGGCSSTGGGGCNATASAWKELYRRYIKN